MGNLQRWKMSEWISKSDKIDWLIYQIRWRQRGGIEIRVWCWGWSRRRWAVGLRMRIACHILWYCCSLLLRPPSLALELKWSASMGLSIYEDACVYSIPRSFYSTRISLFVYLLHFRLSTQLLGNACHVVSGLLGLRFVGTWRTIKTSCRKGQQIWKRRMNSTQYG